MAERSNAAVLKTVVLHGTRGSNPFLSADYLFRRRVHACHGCSALCCQHYDTQNEMPSRWRNSISCLLLHTQALGNTVASGLWFAYWILRVAQKRRLLGQQQVSSLVFILSSFCISCTWLLRWRLHTNFTCMLQLLNLFFEVPPVVNANWLCMLWISYSK